MAEGDGTANTPLMRDGGNEDYDNNEATPTHENDLNSPSAFVWALTLTAGVSGLLFGYEYGFNISVEDYRPS